VDCTSIAACKFSREGTPCAKTDCMAIKVDIVETPATVPVFGGIFGVPNCAASKPDLAFEGTLSFAQPGTYIIYLPLQDCSPKTTFSGVWFVERNECQPVCGTYECGNPTMPINCDAMDEELPAINLLDLQKNLF